MDLNIDSNGYLRYPSVFISDMHLGKKHAQVDMLFEFLSRLKCDKLFIVGDAIEGWGMMKAKHRKFNEMSLRVMDAINAMAAGGTKIIYLPGNHDENLRAHWDTQKMRFRSNKPHKVSLFRQPILDRHHRFMDHETGLSAKYYLTDEMTYVDPQGRRMHVLHGDQFDPRYLHTKSGKILSKAGDTAYDLMIEINGFVSKISRHFFGADFSVSKYAKAAAKQCFSVAESFEQELIKVAQGHQYDGLICGHIHTANVTEKHGALYVNSGDWVESCTAAMHDESGEWRTLDWQEARSALGFTTFASEADLNPFGAYRGVTQQQLKWIQRLWPAKDYWARYKVVRDARREIRALERAVAAMLAQGKRPRKVKKKLNKIQAKLEEELDALALY